MRPLMHDASPPDIDSSGSGLEAGTRVDHALGADGDGVWAGEEGRVGDYDGGGELDGRFGAGLGYGGNDGVAL